MNKTIRTFSIAAVAALAAFGAHADEADASQFATRFEGHRTRAEVNAEAVNAVATRSNEPAGSRVLITTSTADRATVQAEAIQAVRNGTTAHGEFGTL